MYRAVKRLCVMLISMVLLFHDSGSVLAAHPFIDDTPKVLVVYSSKNGELDEHQRVLDMLLGRFTHHLRFVSSSTVKKEDFDDADVLFYYGQQKELLRKSLVERISSFKGRVVAIGYNIEQLGDRFSFVELGQDDVVIDHVDTGNQMDPFSFTPQYALNINILDGKQAEVMLYGKKGQEEYPLFIKRYTDYYFASPLIKQPFSLLLAESLYDVFSIDESMHLGSRLGYLRLEDIHPLVDPKALKEIEHVLNSKNIPYMIAVIPVYTNPETKKQYHLSDSPELLKVLKSMQAGGGSIVLHGYTHQFRLSETGEGFEFWDVDYNMPIYHGPDEEVTVRTRSDFMTEQDYEMYLSEQKTFERDYIVDKVTKGIEELANYGLYPLAFEAPHYTMSQQGYEVLSEFFSTYVGQLQISDNDWQVMTTAPYMTKPTFLHGMQLLPETIGYVEPDDPHAIEKMIEKAKDYQFVREGMVSGFYHPYLGVELFNDLIEELEKVPDVNWIDLKQMNNYVQTENVEIRTENNEMTVRVDHLGLFQTSYEYLDFHLKGLTKAVLWCVAGIGGLAIFNFVIHIFFIGQRNRRVKRRESVG